ncbi:MULTISPECIES: hypothetical protein [unclassified Spirosoma]|uniref:hypothetical protein n=1 Tax=unclassified Spirosoma TaxID=2621999 RepID=UPI00095B2234|nr:MULTISPECIES: hypothetical protein [unclassified Spirosoma]MBN8823582.1 hypothetical protein [Spirosoma sp.]OJW76858.1 MAG: hypothetical protein BGO59_21755 [Spirosoma sp. 48-14]
MKFLIAPIGIAGLVYYFAFRPSPVVYQSQIALNDPVQSVQDSMRVLRQWCEAINPTIFLSCYVRQDSIFHFKVDKSTMLRSHYNIGKIDTVSLLNPGFVNLPKAKVARLLSVIKFLNRNRIGGIVHDTSTESWWYPYQLDNPTDSEGTRHLFLVESAEDTLKPAFTYYYKIIDRRSQLILTKFNDVRPRKSR